MDFGHKTFRDEAFTTSFLKVPNESKKITESGKQEFLSRNGIFFALTSPMSYFCTVFQNTDSCFLFLVKSLDYDDGSSWRKWKTSNPVMYKCGQMDPGWCLIMKKTQLNNWILTEVKLSILPVVSTLNKAVLIKAIAMFMPLAYEC